LSFHGSNRHHFVEGTEFGTRLAFSRILRRRNQSKPLNASKVATAASALRPRILPMGLRMGKSQSCTEVLSKSDQKVTASVFPSGEITGQRHPGRTTTCSPEGRLFNNTRKPVGLSCLRSHPVNQFHHVLSCVTGQVESPTANSFPSGAV